MVYQSTAEKQNNKNSPLNRGRAPVHATRPGMLRGRDLAVTLVSCAAPFARARAPRPTPAEAGQKWARGGLEVATRSHAPRGPEIADEKENEKKHRHLSVQKSAPDFHRFFHHYFHTLFVADLAVAFFGCGVPGALAPPFFAPSRRWASAGEGCAGDSSR